MSLKITSSEFVSKRSLVIDDAGVGFFDNSSLSSFMSKKRSFRFDEIDCVLMSTRGVLSFQVGKEVFSIPTKRGDRKHQEVIDALLRGLKASGSGR
jgi:hypothetical protein